MPRRVGPRLSPLAAEVKLHSREREALGELLALGRLDAAFSSGAVRREDAAFAARGAEIPEDLARALRALLRSGGERAVDVCPCGAEIRTGQGFREVCDDCYRERRRAQHRARTERWREKAKIREATRPAPASPPAGVCSHCGAPLARERLGKVRLLYCKRRCEPSTVLVERSG